MTDHTHTGKCHDMSRYRQINVTISESANGIASVRVRLKPIAECWSNHHTVYHATTGGVAVGEDLADVLLAVGEYFRLIGRDLAQ